MSAAVFWPPEQVPRAKTRWFPNPNNVVFMAQSNQSVSTG